MTIRMIAETVNANNKTVRKILHDKLNMKKVYGKLVPKNLTPDQKFVRQQICSDFLERLNEKPELMENIVACDKTWIFQYNCLEQNIRCCVVAETVSMVHCVASFPIYTITFNGGTLQAAECQFQQVTLCSVSAGLYRLLRCNFSTQYATLPLGSQFLHTRYVFFLVHQVNVAC